MNKHKFYRSLVLAALIGYSLTFVARAQTGRYVETDLVVNKQVDGVPTLVDSNGITHIAKFFDPNLVNPWGIAESATSAFWISQGGAGVATLYNTAGAPQPLVVSIPSPADPLGTGGTPTGAVFNSGPATQGAFKLSGFNSAGDPVTALAIFLFAAKDGTILGWNPGVNPAGFDPAKAGKYAIIAVDNSASAAYTGLAIATDTDGTTRLYAANFRAGTVDVFDTSFKQVISNSAFADPNLPRGYAPFNVAPITINGTMQMFVTYAIQDLRNVFGQGHGIINTYHLDGSVPQRFAQHGQLNAPWGIVLTPNGFGELGGRCGSATSAMAASTPMTRRRARFSIRCVRRTVGPSSSIDSGPSGSATVGMVVPSIRSISPPDQTGKATVCSAASIHSRNEFRQAKRRRASFRWIWHACLWQTEA